MVADLPAHMVDQQDAIVFCRRSKTVPYRWDLRTTSSFRLPPNLLQLGVGHQMHVLAVAGFADEAVAPELLRSERVPPSLGVLRLKLFLGNRTVAMSAPSACAAAR